MNNPDNRLLLHLSLIEGIGPTTVKQMLAHKPVNVAWVQLYDYMASDFRQVFDLSPMVAEKISSGLRDRALIDQECALIEKHDVTCMLIGDPLYPALLADIYAPPTALYTQGAPLADGHTSIAVIGARKANRYGERVINAVVPELVAHGWTIVSGGAVGADTMAHQAALRSGGKTVVVQGSGLLHWYPQSNTRLFESVLHEGGTLVSCFPLGMSPMPGNFPARNRIISGLSRGCLVVQAAVKSGARITANYALERGRDVFAVPGSIEDELSAGCHVLIGLGAKLVANADDILIEYGQGKPQQQTIMQADVEQSAGAAKKAAPRVVVAVAPVVAAAYAVDSIEYKVIQACTESSSVDDLLGVTGVSLPELNAILFDLQLAGELEQNFAGKWERI